MTPLQDSVLIMCFQMMTDTKVSHTRHPQRSEAIHTFVRVTHRCRSPCPACVLSLCLLQLYAGIRQTASSLLRLCLDPEFSRPVSSRDYLRLLDSDGGLSGSNPLVPLLALGGVGSSAAKQLQFDGETDEEGSDDGSDGQMQNPRRYQSHLMQAFGSESHGRRRPQSASEKLQAEQRKRQEQQRRKRQQKARVRVKQNRIVDDTLVQIVYAPAAQAMARVVAVLRAAADRWSALQAAADPMTPSQLASFLHAYPPSLLIDCIDLLSFFALRHSVVFHTFAIDTGVIDLIAAFFPRPTLTKEEQEKMKEKEKRRRAADINKAAAHQHQQQDGALASERKVSDSQIDPDSAPTPSPVSTMTSPSPFPPTAPMSGVAAATTRSMLPKPRIMAPTGVLCAALRFVRICLEIDPIYVQPVRTRATGRDGTTCDSFFSSYFHPFSLLPCSPCPLSRFRSNPLISSSTCWSCSSIISDRICSTPPSSRC